MELIIKNNKYEATLVTDDNKRISIDLRYYPFEMEKYKTSIYMFGNIYDIFKMDKFNNFESCIAGLSLLGGIPKFKVNNTIKSYGGWTNTNWFDLNSVFPEKLCKQMKEQIRVGKFITQEITYECDNEFDILRATIFHFLTKKGKIKKCKKCGRYFMTTTRSDIEYCDRLIDNSNITCKQNNEKEAKISYRADEIIRKKESIATQLSNYNDIYRGDFLAEFAKTKERYKDYKDNEKSRENLIKWLKNNTAKKIIERGGVK